MVKKSEDWVADKLFDGETVAGPFFNGATPDQFTVYLTLDITQIHGQDGSPWKR